MHVLATAGHVDHGKSTLVRALTGMEPDRWAEERRRGMTIDLGYAWTPLPSSEVVAFVDVPGHHRFLSNMLAGVGPAPAAMFVVAADEGWSRQSAEHLAALDALGVSHGLLVVTKSDLADPAEVATTSLEHIATTSLGRLPWVATSATNGRGLAEVRELIDRVVAGLPTPDVTAAVRLWVDRSFSIRGAGTVVTGTLAAGTVRVNDRLRLGDRDVTVRALQTLGVDAAEVPAVARVALNLRDVATSEVRRGDALLTPGAWRLSGSLDVRLTHEVAEQVVLHVGSAAVTVRVRPLGADVARVSLARPLALRAGDRFLIRDPAPQSVVAGGMVLDADPPPLVRRGAAAARSANLTSATGVPDPLTEIRRRGAIRVSDLRALGVSDRPVDGVRADGEWLISDEQWRTWRRLLTEVVDAHHAADPLTAGMPDEAARRALDLPDLRLLRALAADCGFEQRQGRVRRAGTIPSLGPAEPAVRLVEKQLGARPFRAPETEELASLGLHDRELAAAATAGRLLRLPGNIVLLPTAPALAVTILGGLAQPFSLSSARQALDTTRRVAVPLLEHLDRVGLTRRLDGSLRRLQSD
ncbi:MAG TPA: selenocysteine-specific translation elongation factor [Mycobacteriales bacterium]|jgi:selenocysteine-specific elongation factor|nr:selenocysteine-specific translation elongation factor [Mycobacteriales bacterium]